MVFFRSDVATPYGAYLFAFLNIIFVSNFPIFASRRIVSLLSESSWAIRLSAASVTSPH
jgi:hypothetical protein